MRSHSLAHLISFLYIFQSLLALRHTFLVLSFLFETAYSSGVEAHAHEAPADSIGQETRK